MSRLFVLLFFILSTHVVTAEQYHLGPGDKIEITVYDEPDLTTRAKINKTGLITFPFLDDIQVIGLTTKELEGVITQGLLGDYLIHPQVAVSIVEYRPFFIHGQVKRPGGYPYQDDLTLDKAIAIAGGLAARASNDDWKVIRNVNGKTTVIQGNVSTLVLPDDMIKIEQSFF